MPDVPRHIPVASGSRTRPSRVRRTCDVQPLQQMRGHQAAERPKRRDSGVKTTGHCGNPPKRGRWPEYPLQHPLYVVCAHTSVRSMVNFRRVMFWLAQS
jgi:hypothetical protein